MSALLNILHRDCDAEGARMAKGKALSPEMQKLFDSLETPFEKSGGLATASYFECVAWYRKLANAFPAYCALTSIGLGDAGKDIYVFQLLGDRMGRMDRLGIDDEGIAVSPDQLAAPEVKILINNNIHPGEPEGTDASMFLVRDLLFFGQYWQETLPYLDTMLMARSTATPIPVPTKMVRWNMAFAGMPKTLT